MKKIVKLFLIILSFVMLTGCVKINVETEITADKEVNLEIVYAINKTALEELEDGEESDFQNVDVESYKYLEDEGYKVKEYSRKDSEGNKYVGVTITKTFKSIDDISRKSKKEVNFTKLFSDQVNFDDSQLFSVDGHKYSADFVFDFSSDDEISKDMKNMFDLKYTLKIPKDSLVSSNADVVNDDEDVLTWNLEFGKKNKVEYTIKMGKSILGWILTPIIITIVVLFLLFVFPILLIKKKSGKIERSLKNKFKKYNS